MLNYCSAKFNSYKSKIQTIIQLTGDVQTKSSGGRLDMFVNWREVFKGLSPSLAEFDIQRYPKAFTSLKESNLSLHFTRIALVCVWGNSTILWLLLNNSPPNWSLNLPYFIPSFNTVINLINLKSFTYKTDKLLK